MPKHKNFIPNPWPKESPWLTRDEAAKYLKKSVPTLARWAAAGKGPPFYKPGISTSPNLPARYHRADLYKWVEAKRAGADLGSQGCQTTTDGMIGKSDGEAPL